VLQVITGLLEKNGGPIKSALILNNVYLANYSHTLLTIGQNNLSIIGKCNPGQVLQLPSLYQNEYGVSVHLIRIRKNCRSHDVIIHHGFYLASLFYCLMFAKPKTKMVIIAHGSFQKFSRNKKKFLKKTFRIIFKAFAKRDVSIVFAAMTIAEVSDIESCFPDIAISVVGLGFDLDVTKKIQTETFKPTLLCLSRIAQKKRIDLCIKALPIVKKEYPNVKLVIAGTGDSNLIKSLSKLTSSLELENQVSFVGHISEIGAFEKLFSESALLLLPSEDENFALTVGEAIIRGLPVVVSKNVGLSDMVDKYNCGIVISSLSESELGKAILSGLDNWTYYNHNCLENRSYFSHERVKQNWNLLIGN
jgi:glycosyltransferase involved in cell wall biosynthesis